MNVLSLFSGIGGLDLGLEAAGMTVVGQVESDPYCRRVLSHHWPEVPHHDDVRTGPAWWTSRPRPRVDLVAGGFPCQPFSPAGLRRGLDDARWGWPAMADVVRVVRPRWVLVENVPGLLTLPGAFDRVLTDLAQNGFDADWTVLPACALGAPHTRERLFVLAHPPGLELPHQGPPTPPHRAARREPPGDRRRPRGHSGPLPRWIPEPGLGRVADGVPYRLVHRALHAYGNAVVPAVAEHLAHLILTADADTADIAAPSSTGSVAPVPPATLAGGTA